ncbi:DUF2848 domain-containing protein [Streptomyces sp. SHP 1-2]|uniref:DUF2848 domain-containing protein n=1 Tax=Streptomyces sp. SHP 1-2 TaxID=2769489 RepID=UPI00223889E8|nr:DUF2848 domain-containing protein [Streptomyces sp. SHP 1-2]MCW5253012.1 DUF2848 family protein [Streptomyces sp. SHP 1-2]
MTVKTLQFLDISTGSAVVLRPRELVIAGFTGADQESVREHIQELADHGIMPPPHIPIFYRAPVSLLTQDEAIVVSSKESSGEVEPVLICAEDDWYLALGSDHTARDVEKESIPESKVSCPKPVGKSVIPLREAAGDWKNSRIRSYADGALYQEAPLADILPAQEILDSYRKSSGSSTSGLVMFLGTVPLKSKSFEFATHFTAELVKDGAVVLSCSYGIASRSDRTHNQERTETV